MPLPTTAPSHDLGGVTTWIVALARQLIADGVEVAIHLQHEGSDPAQASILPQLADAGIHISISPKQKNLAPDVRQTLAFLNDWQPSVFLPQCQSAHYVAAAIAGQQGLPWALTIHSDDPEYWAVARCLRPSTLRWPHSLRIGAYQKSGAEIWNRCRTFAYSLWRIYTSYDKHEYR